MADSGIGGTGPGDGGPYGPTAFMSDAPVDPRLQNNQKIPGGTSGGPIESVKRAVVIALREAFADTDLQIEGTGIYIDLEYPLKPEEYPGIWVQFSLTKFVRGGLGAEEVIWDPELNQWIPQQVWTFNGRVTLSLVSLKNKSRDRIADRIITEIAFSRTPEVWVTKPDQDTKEKRSLIESINANPYVSITLNTDMINPNGQGVDVGVPWQNDTLAYTDSYSFDLIGQTMVRFLHDGAYTLSRIDINSQTVDSITPEQLGDVPDYPYLPPVGQGSTNQTWRTL